LITANPGSRIVVGVDGYVESRNLPIEPLKGVS
jgi:hypothetical protein